MLKLRVMNINRKKRLFIISIVVVASIFAVLIFSKSFNKMYEIHSNYGFSESNVNEILGKRNVKDAYGSYEIELLNGNVIKSINEKEFILKEGRLPEKTGEIIVPNNEKYKLGDDYLINDSSFKIVGLYKTKFDSNICGYCLADNFDNSSYDSITVHISSMFKPKSVLKNVEKELIEKRKLEVIEIKKEQIIQLEDKYKALEDNIKVYTDEIDSKFETAQEKINNGLKLVNEYQNKINSAKKELDAGKDKLNKAEIELDNASKELAEYRKQIDRAKNELNDRLSAYGISYDELNSFYNKAEQELIKRGYTIKFVEDNLETIENIDYYIDLLNNAIDKGIARLEELDKAPEEELENIREQFENDWDEITYAYNKLKAFLEDAVLDKTIESLSSIKTTLIKLQDRIAEIEELIDIKNNIDDIKYAISIKRNIDDAEIEYSVFYEQYKNGQKSYEDGLLEYDKKLGEYNKALKEFESYKKQLNANKEKLTNEKNKFNSGIAEYNNDLDGTKENIDAIQEEINNITVEWDYSKCLKTKFNVLPIIIYIALMSVIVIAIRKEKNI